MSRAYVWVNKRKPKPTWLRNRNLADYYSWKYWNKIWDATPLWAERDQIVVIYDEASRRRAAGEDVVVDHVVPLTSPLVCGLHWHANLEVISRLTNQRKSNAWWPGHPNGEQQELHFNGE